MLLNQIRDPLIVKTELQLKNHRNGNVPNGEAVLVSTPDGLRLRVGTWGDKSTKHGTVIIFPGRSEYLERFGGTVSAMLNARFSVISVDWRGHGLSDRVADDPKSCHIDDFASYQSDVAALIEFADFKKLPRPWYLFGNSMGGCIGLRALANNLPVVAAVFTAPLWGVQMSQLIRSIAVPTTRLAMALGRPQSYVPGYDGRSYVLKTPFSGNKVTNDEARYSYLVSLAKTNPELEIGGPTLGWLYQCLEECKSLSRLPSPEIPCLAFYGDQDVVVDIGAIERRMESWTRGRCELVKNARHELAMEVPLIRNGVLDKAANFFRMARTQLN